MMILSLQFAHHTHFESDTIEGVSAEDVLRAFDDFDWLGEAQKAERLQRVSPTLSLESDTKDRLIWVSSVAAERGLEFVSECSFPGEVRKWFGLSKGFGTVSLHTQSFDAVQAKEAIALFLEELYPELRELYERV